MITPIELNVTFSGGVQNIILETAPDANINEVIELIRARALLVHLDGQPLFLFLEGADEPLTTDGRLDNLGVRHQHRVHVHHCREIEVTVEDSGQAKTKAFSPGATLEKVKRWAVGAFERESNTFALELRHENGHLGSEKVIGSLTHDCCLHLELLPIVLKIDYTVDDEPQTSDRRHQTPKEILTHAGFDAAQYYLKQIKIGTQGESYKDHPDTPIRLREHEKFSAIFMGGTPVS